MAFRRTIAQRLFSVSRITNPVLTSCRISSPSALSKSGSLNHQTTPSKLAPDPGDDGIFRRHLHRLSAAASPGIRFLPTGEKLLEKIREMDVGRSRIGVGIDGLSPTSTSKPAAETLTVADAKKILRLSQLETVKLRLRQVEKDCIPYPEFVEICARECSKADQGLELAETLDQSGSVIVLGKNVFLRPEKVVKAIQGLIPVPESPFNNANDPRMNEFQELEKQKRAMERRAEFLVRRELWCGLGYLVVQTAAFMRLTFWELTWDVMEPICFYVTSVYFMGGYAFFLRTSKEPSFEGFFQSRFDVKLTRLMEERNFDVERYNELRRAFCPHELSESAVSFASSPVHSDGLRV